MAVTAPTKLRATDSKTPIFNYKEVQLKSKVSRAPRSHSALSSKETAFDYKIPLTKALSVDDRVPAPANSAVNKNLERCVLLLSSPSPALLPAAVAFKAHP